MSALDQALPILHSEGNQLPRVSERARCAKSRELSAEKAGKNLKLFKQPAETSDLVLDVVLAECVPIGCCIDGDHRFAIAPKFQRQPLSQTMNIYSARVFPKGALLPARVPDADAAPSLFCGRRNSPFLVIALV